jgi:mannose-6-phosphate isomerase
MLIEKPWGSEELLEKNDAYVVKRLFMKQGHRCSLQFHEQKQETVYVLSGVLRILVGPTADSLTDHIYRVGDSLTLIPGMVHRMEAVEDALYLEASTPQLDDVVRISDDYSRQ